MWSRRRNGSPNSLSLSSNGYDLLACEKERAPSDVPARHAKCVPRWRVARKSVTKERPCKGNQISWPGRVSSRTTMYRHTPNSMIRVYRPAKHSIIGWTIPSRRTLITRTPWTCGTLFAYRHWASTVIFPLNNNNNNNNNNNVYSVSGEKNALSPFDDKRCILVDRVSTFPWGHYRIPELETHERLELEPDESLENPIV